MRELDTDGILTVIGGFGRFQWILDGLISVMLMPLSYMVLIMYFAALKSDWKCVENSKICVFNSTMSSSNSSRCNMPRSEWKYIESKDYSIVTQFDIYCDREWMIHITTSVTFLGWAIGAIVLGWVADNYGRKIVLFPSVTFCVLIGFLSAFMPNIGLFIACRFLLGFFIPGASVQSFILISEFVGERQRPLAGLILWFFFAVSLCIQALKAYYVRKWSLLLIVSTAPYIFIIAFWKLIPESPRWLVIKGRTNEAIEIFKQIGKWNGKPLPNDVTLVKYPNKKQHKSNLLDLFRTFNLAIKNGVQGYSWMVFGLVFYGLSLASSDLGGSLYRNYVLVSVVQFPAVVVSILGCRYIGRKKTVIYSCLFGSIACIVIGLIPRTKSGIVARIFLGMFSKFCVSTSFDSMYIWSVEIYPTTIRGKGMGFLQITSRIGAASAPWIAKGLIKFNQNLPFFVMGGMSFLSALLMFGLPETKGKNTAETEIEISNTADSSIEMSEKDVKN